MSSRVCHARLPIVSARMQSSRAQQATRLAQREAIDHHQSAAVRAAGVLNFVAACERHHEEDGMFEADPRGRQYRGEKLECLTEALAAHETWQRMIDVRDLHERHDAEKREEACENAGLVLRALSAHKEAHLLWRL